MSKNHNPSNFDTSDPNYSAYRYHDQRYHKYDKAFDKPNIYPSSLRRLDPIPRFGNTNFLDDDVVFTSEDTPIDPKVIPILNRVKREIEQERMDCSPYVKIKNKKRNPPNPGSMVS